MTNTEPHPGAYAELVRPLTERERLALRESLERDGFWPTHPVVVDEEGTIILGHHRHAIATDLGLEPVVRVAAGLTDDEKRNLAVADNLHRRQLTGTERTRLAKQLRGDGMSVRRIAEVMATPKSTVARSLNGDHEEEPDPGVPPGTPGRVTGRDGKTYRATGTKKPKPKPKTRPITHGPDGEPASGPCAPDSGLTEAEKAEGDVEAAGMLAGQPILRLTDKGNQKVKVGMMLGALRNLAAVANKVTPEEFATGLTDEERQEARRLCGAFGKWAQGWSQAERRRGSK